MPTLLSSWPQVKTFLTFLRPSHFNEPSPFFLSSELAKAFKCGVNDLPLSLDISWFEQKAVAVLLTLLHLGVRNIRLGPRLPAFLTADAVKVCRRRVSCASGRRISSCRCSVPSQVLVDTYNLQPADEADPEADVRRMLAKM